MLTFTDLLLTEYAAEIEGLGVLLFVQKLKEENDLVNELLLERGKMEARLKELDDILCRPENASDMALISEYTSVKRDLDAEVDRWERLSEELESVS